MKKIFTLLLLSFSTYIHAQQVEEALAAKLQHTLDSTAKALKMTGVSANVILGDNSTWNGYTGYSIPNNQTPINPEHLFWSASMCKLFVGATLMQLVEEGKIKLSDPIGLYFNDLNNVDTNITLLEIVKHRSGIKEFLSQDVTSQWYTNPNKIWDPKAVLKAYVGPKEFNRGTRFSYSNSNFVLLGLVIEKVTGNSLATELRNRFFTPLGMSHSYFMPEDKPTETVTPCWSDFNQDGVWNDQANFILTPSFSSMVFGAGAILTQSADVSKFTRAVFRAELFNQSLVDEMKLCSNVSFGPNSTGYGIATMRYKFFNRDYFGHGGDISGFTTLTMHEAETNVTITLMINNDNQNRAALAAALIKTLNENPLGIANNLSHTKLSIDQNPVTDCLHFRLDNKIALNTKALILSLEGKTIAESNNITPSMQMDVSKLSSGLYLLRIVHPDGGFTQEKFIKQ